MSQSDDTTITNPTNDPYVARCILLANATNQLYTDLEKVLAVENLRKSPFLDNLAQIESWLDDIATRQEARLTYIRNFSDGA